MDTWPDFAHALQLGNEQEKVAEAGLTENGWQLYLCDVKRNPILLQSKTASPIHFVPQATWITMPLDTAAWVGDLLRGEAAQRWASYESRGEALWQEFDRVHRPVVNDLLKELVLVDSQFGDRIEYGLHQLKDRQAAESKRDTETLILEAKSALTSAQLAYNTWHEVTQDVFSSIRELYLAVNFGTNASIPVGRTCSSGQSEDTVV